MEAATVVRLGSVLLNSNVAVPMVLMNIAICPVQQLHRGDVLPLVSLQLIQLARIILVFARLMEHVPLIRV